MSQLSPLVYVDAAMLEFRESSASDPKSYSSNRIDTFRCSLLHFLQKLNIFYHNVLRLSAW